MKRHILLGSLLLFSQMLQARPQTPTCKPFLVHRQMSMPILDNFEQNLMPALAELKGILAKAFPQSDRPRLPRQSILAETFAALMDSGGALRCILPYVSQDTDQDGIVDWTPFNEGNFSRTLIPLDPDMDGDGTDNVLDPEPLRSDISWQPGEDVLPAHILEQNDTTLRALQIELYQRFGIIALNYTDQHHPLVLRQLLRILTHGLPAGSLERIRSFRYLYAFSGLRAQKRIATTHYALKAIAIGGQNIYTSADLPLSQEAEILAALAHEIGHTVVFSLLDAQQLFDIATRFGPWEPAPSQPETLFSPLFFRAYRPAASQIQAARMPSQYALKNIHEWFAEVFAGFIIGKMRALGQLSAAEDRFLAQEYQNIPKDLTRHLQEIITPDPVF